MSMTNEAPPESPGGRLLQVLEAFTYGPAQQTLDEVRERVGLPRTTTHRALRTLVANHWLTHAPGGYSVHERALHFAQRFNRELVRSAASCALNEIQLSSGAVAHLSVLEGPLICHLDKIGGKAWKDIPSHIGTRLPAVNTAAGRALLACLETAELEKVLLQHAQAGLPEYDRDRLDADMVLAASRKGVVTRDGRSHLSGISTAAAPVMLHGDAVAAISLAWRGERLSTEHAAALIVEAVRDVSAELRDLSSR